MITFIEKQRKSSFLFRCISFFVCLTFITSLIVPPYSYAQTIPNLNLPAPSTLVSLSPSFTPALLRGVTVHPENPLLFDFIVDKGESGLEGEDLTAETTKLVKYFLASLAVPKDDLWVNLSPYEGERIIPDKLGITDMGRDMLAQDYILKQITASLIYPEDEIGQKFWEKVYARAYETLGTTEIPVNTFNKVWIVPQKAVVYQNGATAYIVNSKLKVMLEEDFLALDKNANDKARGTDRLRRNEKSKINKLSSEVVRDTILPILEKEVNEGENFALLRQIYRSHVLASWFKKTLQESLLAKVYADSNKTQGIDIADREVKQKIYNQYLKAYQEGVYNFVKEEYDQNLDEVIPRKYFSGGLAWGDAGVVVKTDPTQLEPSEISELQTRVEKADDIVSLAYALEVIKAANERPRDERHSAINRYIRQNLPDGLGDTLPISTFMREITFQNIDDVTETRRVAVVPIDGLSRTGDWGHVGLTDGIIYISDELADNEEAIKLELFKLDAWEKFLSHAEVGTAFIRSVEVFLEGKGIPEDIIKGVSNQLDTIKGQSLPRDLWRLRLWTSSPAAWHYNNELKAKAEKIYAVPTQDDILPTDAAFEGLKDVEDITIAGRIRDTGVFGAIKSKVETAIEAQGTKTFRVGVTTPENVRDITLPETTQVAPVDGTNQFTVPIVNIDLSLDAPSSDFEFFQTVFPDLQRLTYTPDTPGASGFRKVFLTSDVVIKTAEGYSIHDIDQQIKFLTQEYVYQNYKFDGLPFARPIMIVVRDNTAYIVEERGHDARAAIRDAFNAGNTAEAKRIIEQMAVLLRFFVDQQETPTQFDPQVNKDGDVVVVDVLSHRFGGSQNKADGTLEALLYFLLEDSDLQEDKTEVRALVSKWFWQAYENPRNFNRYQELSAKSDIFPEMGHFTNEGGDAGVAEQSALSPDVFALGMRDISTASSGAFTGQNSKALAHDVGASFVLIDEPRESGEEDLTGEDDKAVALKINQALRRDNGQDALTPIIRVELTPAAGERVEITEDNLGQWAETLRERLKGFANNPKALENLIIVPKFVTSAGLQIPGKQENFSSVRGAIRQAFQQLPFVDDPNNEISNKVKLLQDRANMFSPSEVEDALQYTEGIVFTGQPALTQDIYNIILSRVNDVANTPKFSNKEFVVVSNLTAVAGENSTREIQRLENAIRATPDYSDRIQAVVIPTNLDLRRAGQAITHNGLYKIEEQPEATNIHFALQDLENTSPEYLEAVKNDGYTFVLMGHSEVRRFFATTDAQVNEQAKAALSAGLIPVIAVGEKERTEGWDARLRQQTLDVIADFSADDLRRLRIAYEPIAFIGSGTSMSTDQIEEANTIIRDAVQEHVKSLPRAEDIDVNVGILYGGSVKPSSAYGQSGGWEKNSLLTTLRRLQDVTGGLVGGRSLIPGDPDRISDRFAENALAKGKPVRGESGGNWKMNVHTLEDAVRRVSAFQKNIDKNKWKGEFYFAVPAAMGGELAKKFRGEYAPTQIDTLDWTPRQVAINTLVNRFWTWWEDQEQNSSIESLQQALFKFQEMYNQDQTMLDHGVSWFRVFEPAILSNLFSDKKTVVPAANLLVRLRFSPLAHVLSELRDEGKDALADSLADIFDRKELFHSLDEDEVRLLMNFLYKHFKLTDYEKVVLNYALNGVIHPEGNSIALARPSDEFPEAQQRVKEHYEGLIESRSRVVNNPESSITAVVAALWELNDLRNNTRLTTAAREAASTSIEDARNRWGGNYEVVNRIIAEMEEEISGTPIPHDFNYSQHPLPYQIALNARSLAFRSSDDLGLNVSLSLHGVTYMDVLTTLTAETTDERIELAFDAIGDIGEREISVLDQLRDHLSLENEPSRSIRSDRAQRQQLLEEVNYARIWGGLKSYFIRNLKIERDKLKERVEQPQDPQLAEPIQEDPRKAPYEVKVVDPARVAIDVNGLFGKKLPIAYRNTVDQFFRRSLGAKRGQGFDPNINLTEITGINSNEELHAFVDFFRANPYHGRSELEIRILNEFTERDIASIEVKDALGNTRIIGVSSSGRVIDSSIADHVINVTDYAKPENDDADKYTRHDVTPLQDSVSPQELDFGTIGYNTGLTDSLQPLMDALNEKYGVKSHSLVYATPGDSHNLQPLQRDAGYNLRSDSLRAGYPHWETHATKGAGFVQLYLTLKSNQVDVEEMTNFLKSAKLDGKPIYFAEGYKPNAISVQEHDKPLVLEKNISVQGNGKLVTLRAWVPDWVQADTVLNNIIDLTQEQEKAKYSNPKDHADALADREVGVTVRNIDNFLSKGEKTEGKVHKIGIYGADEVVAGQMFKQLRGDKNIVVKSVYIDETTDNPLEPSVFVAYLKQIMPDADIYLGPTGDTVIFNNSSPIKVHIGKREQVPDWKNDDVETVVVAHKWAKNDRATHSAHKDKGAKRVVIATNPRAPIETVVNLSREIFKGSTISGEIVHNNTAVDPFRDRAHDIVANNRREPAPFGNLIPEANENTLDVQSSHYDANLTTVTFTLDDPLSKENILARLRQFDRDNKNFVVLDGAQKFSPSLFVGTSIVYVHPESIIVKGNMVSATFGYDFANIWAKEVLDIVKSDKEESPEEATPRERRPQRENTPFKARTNMVDFIPAPAVPELKRLSDKQKQVSRVAVDVSEVPFDASQRNSADYFTDSLVYALMGDQRLSISFHGVKTVENFFTLYRNIKKRLPNHADVSFSGFKDDGYGRPAWNEDGVAYITINGAKIKVARDSILDNPQILNDDRIDSILAVNESGSDNAYRSLIDQYQISGVTAVAPGSENQRRLAYGLVSDTFGSNGSIVKNFRFISTYANRTSEHEVSYQTNGVTIKAPTRLEGDLHNLVVEFGEDKTREEILELVEKLKDRVEGEYGIQVTDLPLASLDMVNNKNIFAISTSQITGSKRLWSIPIWSSETGSAQLEIERLVDFAESHQEKAKATGEYSRQSYSPTLPAMAPLAPVDAMPGLADQNKKVDLVISAIAGRTGKNMLLAAIGDPNVNLLGVTLNRPNEEKVKATVHALNDDTVYGRPGIIFEYGGYLDEDGTYIIWAGSAETGWMPIKVFDGSNHQGFEKPIKEWKERGYKPRYLYAVGSGYHRFKEKGWLEVGFHSIQYGNPGKGESLLIIPGATEWQDPELARLVKLNDIDCLGSCTTGAVAGSIYDISNLADYTSGITLHELTNDQRLNHGPLHDSVERLFASAATTSMSSSGAGNAVGKMIQSMKGRSAFVALREGYGGSSVVNIAIKLKPEVREGFDMEAVKDSLREASKREEIKDVLYLHDEPYKLDADEVKGITASSVVDLNSFRIEGDLLLYDAWYDNERAFSTRMVDLAKRIEVLETQTLPVSGGDAGLVVRNQQVHELDDLNNRNKKLIVNLQTRFASGDESFDSAVALKKALSRRYAIATVMKRLPEELQGLLENPPIDPRVRYRQLERTQPQRNDTRLLAAVSMEYEVITDALSRQEEELPEIDSEELEHILETFRAEIFPIEDILARPQTDEADSGDAGSAFDPRISDGKRTQMVDILTKDVRALRLDNPNTVRYLDLYLRFLADPRTNLGTAAPRVFRIRDMVENAAHAVNESWLTMSDREAKPIFRGIVQQVRRKFGGGDAGSAVRPPGGIHLGKGEFLEVIDVSESGMPVFDKEQFIEFQKDFKGVIPVPLLTPPVPVQFPIISGVLEEPTENPKRSKGAPDGPLGPSASLEKEKDTLVSALR